MDGPGAREVVNQLSAPNPSGLEDIWRDPQRVATTTWRPGALDSIADPLLRSDGTILVELELSSPHPTFYGIVRVDDRGIWYSDADGGPEEPVWRLALIPWSHVEQITLHQSS